MGETEGLTMLFRKLGVLAMLQLKPLSSMRASHHPAVMGNSKSQVFSLIHAVREFSFKEMRTWDQSNTSS